MTVMWHVFPCSRGCRPYLDVWEEMIAPWFPGRGPFPTGPVAVDLFCGAGGLSLGLVEAGLDVVLAVDSNHHALGTYYANLGDRTCTLEWDVRELTGDIVLGTVEMLTGRARVDVVAGAPPCPSFSILSRGKLRSLAGRNLAPGDDPRDELIFEFLRIVDETQPRRYLMENVPGLNMGMMKPWFEKFLARSRDLGYVPHWKVLNAADFGVPQNRKRIFVLGAPEGEEARFPEPTFGAPDSIEVLSGQLPPYHNVWEAIGDLPSIEAGNKREAMPYDKEPTEPYQRWARGLMTWEEMYREELELTRADPRWKEKRVPKLDYVKGARRRRKAGS